MNRKFKNKFNQDQGSFESKIKTEVQADGNGNISVDQLKNFILKECEADLRDRKINKKDIECFLSSFNYN